MGVNGGQNRDEGSLQAQECLQERPQGFNRPAHQERRHFRQNPYLQINQDQPKNTIPTPRWNQWIGQPQNARNDVQWANRKRRFQ